MSKNVLLKEYKDLAKEKWVEIELDEADVYIWNIALIVLNPDSLYYGGYFKAQMKFPKDYPYSPPGFRFLSPVYHPNIYPDGRVCISILHAPGEDGMSGESAAERWSPAQRVESVLISILSLLDDAEVSSPANVDASVLLRKDPARYKERVKMDVKASRNNVPEGFIMPTHESTKPVTEKLDDDFWVDSDVDEDTFGGSDSDGEMTVDDDYDNEDEDDEDDEDEDDEHREESKEEDQKEGTEGEDSEMSDYDQH